MTLSLWIVSRYLLATMSMVVFSTVSSAWLATAQAQQSPSEHLPQRRLYEELQSKKSEIDESEARVNLPASSLAAEPLAFTRSQGDELLFSIDAKSIAHAGLGVVRFILVAQGKDGTFDTRNTSYESINCVTRELKVHALARADGSWREIVSEWRPIRSQHHVLLANDFLCNLRSSRSASQALSRLRSPESALKRDYP
jgi:hypothetical protein